MKSLSHSELGNLLCGLVLALKLSAKNRQRFSRVFRTVGLMHLSAYGVLLAKLFFIDGWQDIPAFVLSHLFIHHVLCAVVAATATFMAIHIYLKNNQKISKA